MSRQIERLRPHQIRARLDERSLIWLPLGTIEWHCEHLPVGLDALTAHALCLAAAEEAGGLVWPPLYYGTGGDHGGYPWTVMMPGPEEIETLLRHTLSRLADMEVARCVILSGHFAGPQLDMIDRVSEAWNARGREPRTTAAAVNGAGFEDSPPDHAGAFETLLMAAADPEAVALDRLPPLAEAPDDHDRHDPVSPVWGVVGADPRGARLEDAPELWKRMVDWLVSRGVP